MLWAKILFVGMLCIGYQLGSSVIYTKLLDEHIKTAARQLDDDRAINQTRDDHFLRTNGYGLGWGFIGLLSVLLFYGDVKQGFLSIKKAMTVSLVLLSLLSTGCWKPFEPVKLEVVHSNEVAFLLPFANPKSQSATNSEEYLQANMVQTQQIRLPQQWVPKGYEWFGVPNGEWQDGGLLIKVDTAPVTREWTADPNSGTSNKNEAVWVMTADQVEFSTGWTCTARIKSREDAVRFLHNYRNSTLKDVMDGEIRAKLQAEFGIEVTDLPMDELRKHATPHIEKVVKSVVGFFAERGITITNFGITGGFVYKDPSIIATLVKVFNAEQEKTIALAKTNTQEQMNKQIQLEATAEAQKILTARKAEADGIKMVADAKAYEMQKAKESQETYMALKQIELQMEQLKRWDGKFPVYFMGSQSPNMLLQVPAPSMASTKK